MLSAYDSSCFCIFQSYKLNSDAMVTSTFTSFNSLNVALIFAISNGIRYSFWFIIFFPVWGGGRGIVSEMLTWSFFLNYNVNDFTGQRTHVKIPLLSIYSYDKIKRGEIVLELFSRPLGLWWDESRHWLCHLGFIGKEHCVILIPMTLMSTNILHQAVHEILYIFLSQWTATLINGLKSLWEKNSDCTYFLWHFVLPQEYLASSLINVL